MSVKPGRNDPCPCGSGRKYKLCCGSQSPAAGSAAGVLAAVGPAWYSPALADLGAGRLAAAIMRCEPSYRRNPNQPECRSFADQLLGVVNKECDAFARAPGAETAGRLLNIRLQMAAAFIALQPGSLPGSWTLVSRPYARLMASGLRDLTRASSEDDVLSRLAPQLGETSAATSPAALLAAILLARNYELPLIADFERLPDWLRPVYFALLLESPAVFNRVGEVDRYADYLERLTDLVHRRFTASPAVAVEPVVRELGIVLALRSNYLQAQFTSRNLRPLCEKRGRIIAAFLASQNVPTLATLVPDLDGSGRKIRLGIFAHQFAPGRETYHTLAYFEYLDRERFDITLYSLARSEHPLEQYCASRADRFVELHPTDFASQIGRIRADRLDILLIGSNMTAHTMASCLLGAVRLAPIQVATGNSPVSSGGAHVDVMLSAQWNEPQAHAQEHYTEYLEQLPGTINYYACQHDRDPVTVEVSRARLGIPADAVVFFSGASFHKILPELSESWARILAAVPGSIMLLMPFNPNWGSQFARMPFLARVHEQLRAHGVAPERLRIFDTVPSRADVQQVVGLADVYLDAYPFAGGCSMLDPIQAGIPAVVRQGAESRANRGAALLRLVGLKELVCDSEPRYIAKAVELAGNATERQRIREHLQELARAPIPVYYDMPLFASRVGAAFERLYRQGHERYSRLAVDGAGLRSTLEATAGRLIGRRLELNALTGAGVVRLLVEPYFESPPAARFLNVDDPGNNFEALDSLNVEHGGPELALVGLGAHRLPASAAAIDAALARMGVRGYGAVIMLCTQDENLARSAWHQRLRRLCIDRLPPVDEMTRLADDPANTDPAAANGEVTGCILFYPGHNPRLLLMLQSLLDCCDDPRRIWAPPACASQAIPPTL